MTLKICCEEGCVFLWCVVLCAVCNASEAAVICPVAKLMEVWRLHVTVQTNKSPYR